MTERLNELADRVERGKNQYGDWYGHGAIPDLTREVEEFDEHPNRNGTCADYLCDLYDAKRLIPAGFSYSISRDGKDVRAVVARWLSEADGGFSAIPDEGHFAETRALVAAALRARSRVLDGEGGNG